jgi:hypothetical protein
MFSLLLGLCSGSGRGIDIDQNLVLTRFCQMEKEWGMRFEGIRNRAHSKQNSRALDPQVCQG